MKELTAEKALIFRITHVANVAWALNNGLHCKNADVLDPQFVEIGNPDLITKRSQRPVPIAPGGTLSDYVPFYYTPCTPMLYNIKTGYNGMKQTAMRDVAIFVSSLHRLIELGVSFVITDRHAYLQAAVFSSDVADLSVIDWKILRARDFKRDPNDPGKMERYQAEALVHRHLPITALLGIVCYSDAQQTLLTGQALHAGVDLKVIVRPGWYV